MNLPSERRRANRRLYLTFLTAAVLLCGRWCALGEERIWRFAILGDIDPEGSNTAAVAKLLTTYATEPADPAIPHGPAKGLDFLIAVGDLNYDKKASLYSKVGKVFPDFVRSPSDSPKPEELRFFPALGNHEYHYKGDGSYDPARLKAFEAAFAVPPGEGGVHYYEFERGPVHFFALDSNAIVTKENGNTNVIWDGSDLDSKQEQWFRQRLDAVKADAKVRWRLAFFHHPIAHSSIEHASEKKRMAPWKLHQSGVSAVFSGHVHLYERLDFDGVPFFVTGAGGTGLAPFFKDHSKWAPQSKARYPEPTPKKAKAEHFGALFCEATPDTLRFEFRNARNEVIDRLSLP